MRLEELTKEELIAYIKQRHFTQPTQRDMLDLRWERLTQEAKAIMELGIRESEKWTGQPGMEARRMWFEAQEIFNKGIRLSEEAEKIFDEMSNCKE
jgi:hypothetical protein